MSWPPFEILYYSIQSLSFYLINPLIWAYYWSWYYFLLNFTCTYASHPSLHASCHPFGDFSRGSVFLQTPFSNSANIFSLCADGADSAVELRLLKACRPQIIYYIHLLGSGVTWWPSSLLNNSISPNPAPLEPRRLWFFPSFLQFFFFNYFTFLLLWSIFWSDKKRYDRDLIYDI